MLVYFHLKNFGTRQCIRFPKYSSFPKFYLSSQSSNELAKSVDSSSKDDWINIETGEDIDERVVPKPISKRPDHVPQARKRIRQKPWWKFRYFIDINTLPIEESEYTEEPQYPPIYHPSKEGLNKKIRFEWYDAIKRLPTAQQKIYEITKHYGHLTYLIEPTMKTYNGLPIQKYITRTHLVDCLPDNYGAQVDQSNDVLKEQILSLIASRLFSTRSRQTFSFYQKQNTLSSFGFSSKENLIKSYKEEDILADIARLIQNHKQPKDFNIQIDYNPFVGTSWWMGNFPVPFKKKKWKMEDNHNQCFVYKEDHGLHIRTELPLPKVVEMNHDLCLKSEFPEWKTNLLRLEIPLKRHNIQALPGFWPDQSNGFDFPYLLALTRENLRQRKEKTGDIQVFNDDQDVLDGMAITSAFSWLTSIASNLGFTIYDRLTYPLVTNVVITDGQYWSFYVYQLNNHCFHDDLFDPKDPTIPCNICWSSGDMKLFDSFENGQLTNVNSAVLEQLIKFLMMEPQPEINYNLRPYLSADERPQQDKDELNYSLRRKFSNASSSYIARRKKTNLWETIYKNHKDAPFDVKRIRPKITFKYPPFFK